MTEKIQNGPQPEELLENLGKDELLKRLDKTRNELMPLMEKTRSLNDEIRGLQNLLAVIDDQKQKCFSKYSALQDEFRRRMDVKEDSMRKYGGGGGLQ